MNKIARLNIKYTNEKIHNIKIDLIFTVRADTIVKAVASADSEERANSHSMRRLGKAPELPKILKLLESQILLVFIPTLLLDV